MNILFVYSVDDIFSPVKPLRSHEEMQFGISYISSFLKKHGHRTELVVLSRMLGRTNDSVLRKTIESFRPSLVCFTAVTSEYRFVVKMASYVRKHFPDIYQVIGGSHVSLDPKGVLDNSFDALCIGEGELPMLELVNKLASGARVSGIKNLWMRNGNAIEKNATREYLKDIDSLPFPDRDMWQRWVAPEYRPSYPVLLGRGCPFQCTYCCNHALRKISGGTYVRMRSPGNIAGEIREVALGGSDRSHFYLEVETIGSDMDWALRLCSELERLSIELGRKLSFGTNLRITPNAELERLFSAFKKSNFKYIKIGVESGSERVRRDVLKRNYSNADIAHAVKIARKYGLEIYFYNLIGVPGETASDFGETVELNRVCLPDKAFAHIFFPYPGTELYSVCVRDRLLNDISGTELERCKATLDLRGFSRKQIQKSFVWFDYNVYKGHRPLKDLLTKVLISKCRSDVRLHRLYRTLSYSRVVRRLKKICSV